MSSQDNKLCVVCRNARRRRFCEEINSTAMCTLCALKIHVNIETNIEEIENIIQQYYDIIRQIKTPEEKKKKIIDKLKVLDFWYSLILNDQL